MNNKKGLPLILIIIAIIIGSAIIKDFDFENLKFEKPALAVVYILTLLMCVYFIITSIKRK